MSIPEKDTVESFFSSLLSDYFGRHVNVAIERIDLASIKTVPKYQRSIQPKVLKDITENFSPGAVGLFAVNERPNGTTWLIDGNHRRIAATENGHASWWAIKSVGLEEPDEARLWRFYNRHRSPPKTYEVLSADIRAKDPEALELLKVCHKYGFKFTFENKRNGAILSCVSTLYLLKRRDFLEPVLQVASTCWNGDGYSTRSCSLKALMLVLSHPDNQEILDRGRLINRLRKESAKKLYTSAKDRVSKKNPTRLMAEEISLTYNHGLLKAKRIRDNYDPKASYDK